MSFRQPKSHRHADDRAWRAWLARHEPALRAAGLPPGVTLSEAHWLDFLENGSLDWHREDYDGFQFDQLTADQMARLLAILEASPEYARKPMAGWLRHRLGGTDAG